MLEKQNIAIVDDKTIWDDLGVSAMLTKMRARKWLLFFGAVIWLLLSNSAFLIIEKDYLAELLVVPASLGGDSGRSGGLSSMLGGIGLDIGGLGQGLDQNFSIYLETWTSPWFAQQLLQNPDLSHRIFASRWSKQDQRWIRPNGVGIFAASMIKEIFGGTLTSESAPDTEAMLKFLQDHVVQIRSRTQITTQITIALKDRKLAEDLLEFGHKSINAHMAALFRARADQNVGYILNELNRVSVADYRQALLTTLAQVEHTRMLAFSNPEFAAMSLTVYVTSRPVKPAPVQVILVSLLMTILIYSVVVIFADRIGLPHSFREVWKGLFGSQSGS